jgi:hypothetical protein
MKGCWILSKAFSASIEMIMWFLLFFSLYAVLHLMIHVCWTISTTLRWNRLDHSVQSFDMLLDLFYQYFIEEFGIIVY